MSDKSSDFYVYINGVELRGSDRKNILSMEFEESITDTSRFTIVISDHENFGLTSDIIKLGAEVKLGLGYYGEVLEVFAGEIVEVGNTFGNKVSSRVSITALDRSYRFKRVPIPIIYSGENFNSLYDVSKRIVEAHGLNLVVSPSDGLSKYALSEDQSIEQTSTTDWETLNKMAKTGNYRLFCRDNTVYIVDDNYLEGDQGKSFVFIQNPLNDNLDSLTIPLMTLSVGFGSQGQREKVQVISWKPSGTEKAEADVNLEDTTSDGKVYTDIKIKGSKVETIKVEGVVRDEKQARILAKGEMQRRADNLVTGSGKVQGNPYIRFGGRHRFTINDLGSVGSIFNGYYYVTKTTHVIDNKEGYTTKFEVRRNGVTVS